MRTAVGGGAPARAQPRPWVVTRGVLQNCYNSRTGPQQAKMLFSTCCRPALNLLWATTAPQQPLLSGLLWGCFGAHNKACSRGATYNSSRTARVLDQEQQQILCSRPGLFSPCSRLAVGLLSACCRALCAGPWPSTASSAWRSRPAVLSCPTGSDQSRSIRLSCHC